MDWNKMGAIGSLGSFLIGAGIFAIQIWPWPQLRHSFSSVAVTTFPSSRLLGIFLVIGFLLSAASIYGAWNKNIPPNKSEKAPVHHETISNRIFTNESVVIDGKTFDHCTFNDVTLTFHGNGDFDFTFIEPKFSGKTIIQTDNPATSAYQKMLSYLQNFPSIDQLQIGTKDKTTGEISISNTYKRAAPEPDKK